MSTNELLERYLQAVRFWLPRAHQQDILAELAEDLQSQIEDREASLGRPLTEDDMVALLQQRGAPMRVASGFVPQLRLVDPATLPVYLLVLKVALLYVLTPIYALTALGRLAAGSSVEVLGELISDAIHAGFWVIGAVTVAFAVFDRYQGKFRCREAWNPRKLPPVSQASDASLRWNRLVNALFSFAAAAFWIWFGRITEISSHIELPGGYGIEMAAIWRSAYWVVLAVTLIDAASDFATFLNPPFGRVRSRIRIGLDAVMIAMASLLLSAPHWVTVSAAKLTTGQLAKLMLVVNGSIRACLICAIAIALIDAFVNIRRLANRAPMTLTQVPPVHL